ncbi:MAG: hypothetical protein JWM88_697 [Verrucomicrobia bacterium]|nr:hypothetical protein [Verrucomicrobiota bacterium]
MLARVFFKFDLPPHGGKTAAAMKLPACMVSLVLLATAASGAERLAKGQVFPELRLKNGQVLHQVTVVSVGSDYVMARWDEGRGNLPLSVFPFEADAPRTRGGGRSAKPANPSPEPAKPANPAPVRGSIGDETGPRKTILGRVEISGPDGAALRLPGVRIYAFGLKEFNDLNEKYYAQANPLFEYYQTMVHRKSTAHEITAANALLEQMEALFDQDLTYLPKGPRTETDPDGEFKLEHTLKEPYVVTARALRYVGDKTERYRWVVKSTDIVGSQVLLSSDNLKH